MKEPKKLCQQERHKPSKWPCPEICGEMCSLWNSDKCFYAKATELGIRAVKAFPDLFSDAWKHDVHPYGTLYKCKQCKKDFPWHGNSIPGLNDKPCTVPPPIDINCDNAMMLRDKMRNNRIWNDACYEIWKNYTGKAVTQEVFWRDYAIPKHYIEAAIITKEKG